MMKILITGPQGSGKTTQAKILAQKLNLCFVSAGDLAREFAQSDLPEARTMENDLRQGDLVDDEMLLKLVMKRLERADCANGFVSDSYPRTKEQSDLYDPDFDKVFYLKISDTEAMKRLLKRGREDDTPKVITHRLKWFHSETEPLIKSYRERGKLVMINGEQSIEKVALDIVSYIGEN